MSPRTRLILLTIIVALLFSVTLIVRIFVPDSTSSNASSRPPDAAKNRVFLALAGLSPGIDLTQLNCNGRRADRPLTLTANLPECRLRIGRAANTKVRSARLSTDTAGLTVYVVGVFEEARAAKAQRDKRTCLLDEDDLTAFRLVVEYQPRNPPEGETWSCFLKQNKGDNVTVVALEDGGVLNLLCVGCEGSDRRVTLLLE